MQSTIELSDLKIAVAMTESALDPGAAQEHLLGLRLVVDPGLVLIDADSMEHVFDYEPLVAEIDRLARDGQYHTQERLITRIARACAACPEIRAADVSLCKTPVLAGSGRLGLRVVLDAADLDGMRAAPRP